MPVLVTHLRPPVLTFIPAYRPSVTTRCLCALPLRVLVRGEESAYVLQPGGLFLTSDWRPMCVLRCRSITTPTVLHVRACPSTLDTSLVLRQHSAYVAYVLPIGRSGILNLPEARLRHAAASMGSSSPSVSSPRPGTYDPEGRPTARQATERAGSCCCGVLKLAGGS